VENLLNLDLKKDMLAALNLEEPNYVPVAPYILSNYAPKLCNLKISDFFLGTPELKAKVLLNAWQRHRYNWILTGLWYPKDWLKNKKIIDKGDFYVIIDEKGMEDPIILPKDGTPIYRMGDLTPENAVEKWESELEDHQTILKKGCGEVTKIISEKAGKQALVTGILGAPFGDVICRLGFTEGLKCVLKNPTLIKRLSEISVKQYVEQAKALLEVGAEAFWIEEVFAGSDTISPKHFVELALPYEKMLVEEIKKLGAKTILYFCGDPMPIIERIISIPVDALAFEEDKKKIRIDIVHIRELVKGKICLFGNFDTIRTLRDKPIKVEEEVKKMILKLAPNGGFVLGTGSPVLKDVPPKNIDTMIKAARKYGKYPIKLTY